MNIDLARDLGFLGINVDSNFDVAWLKTEVANKVREGDKTSVYRLVNFARHSEDKEVRDYANTLMKTYEKEIEEYSTVSSNSTENEEPIEYTEVSDVKSINDQLADDTKKDINLSVSEDLKVAKDKPIDIPSGKTVRMKLDKNINADSTAILVRDGSELILEGSGTITKGNLSETKTAIQADGKDAKVIVDGVTIDCISNAKSGNNYSGGILLSHDASVEFKSGVIKTGYGSGISTNNTLGGSSEINITGGEIYSEGSYAIYIASHVNINITGGIIQGINARMGTFNIGGDAKIIPTTITKDSCDDIGANISTTGCIWFGDTIAVISGTYSDSVSTDCVFNIKDNASIESKFRSAFGIYEVDTKEAQNVTVNIESDKLLKTLDPDFKDIMVYDHDYITEAAKANNKTYTPKVDSNVTVNVSGKKVYPVA